MPDMTSWSCKAYAYLFSGLCKFSLGDNEGLKRDVEHAVSTDPLIEANILAGLLLDFEFSYDKTYTIIDAVLSVQPDNTYFKCLRELLSAYHNFNEQTAQTALSNYENLDAEGIAKRSVDKGTLSVAAELVRSKLK